MDYEITDVKSLISLWPKPSSKTFASDVGVNINAVWAMRNRNTIDQKYLWDIYNAAQGRNICLSADQILKVVAAGRKKASSKQEGGEIAA